MLTDVSDGNVAPFSGNAAGGLYNFGTSGADDRALGMIASSTIPAATLSPGMAQPDSAIELAIINDSGTELASIDVRWTTEQWRASATLTNSTPILAYFAVDPTQGSTQMPAEFNLVQINQVATAIGLDGNAAENRAAAGGIFTPAVPIPDGSEFYIRWVDNNDANGTDMGVGIDDFTFAGIPVPEPGVACLGLLAPCLLRRRRRRV